MVVAGEATELLVGLKHEGNYCYSGAIVFGFLLFVFGFAWSFFSFPFSFSKSYVVEVLLYPMMIYILLFSFFPGLLLDCYGVP